MGTAVIVILDIHQISNSMCVGNEKTQAMQWITLKQTPTPSTMRSVMVKSSPWLSAQNLGTLSLRLRWTSSSCKPVIKPTIVCKPLTIASQVDPHTSEVGSLCISPASDFRNTRTGWLTLRGLFHQKMYIMKFMTTYASVTISRWVTGRCLWAHAMHCITNHNIWSRTRDLASQSLFPLSLISASVGTPNEEKSMSVLIVVPFKQCGCCHRVS